MRYCLLNEVINMLLKSDKVKSYKFEKGKCNQKTQIR